LRNFSGSSLNDFCQLHLYSRNYRAKPTDALVSEDSVVTVGSDAFLIPVTMYKTSIPRADSADNCTAFGEVLPFSQSINVLFAISIASANPC
jgi:hypothetical protein